MNHRRWQHVFLSPVAWLVIAIVIFCIMFTYLGFAKFSLFGYDNLDLGIFTNVLHNTVHGNWLASAIHEPSYLGDHFNLWLLILAPLYSLWPDARMLLLLQAVIVALTAWPVFKLARHFFGDSHPWLPLYTALLWLNNPLVHNFVMFEFHELPFAVFTLFWTIYYYLKARPGWFSFWLMATLLVREDMGLITLFFSLIALAHHRKLFWKLFPGIISVLYMAVAFYAISLFAPANVYKFSIYYGWLGGTNLPSIIWSFIAHPFRVIEHVITWFNLEFVLALLFPLLFLINPWSPFLLLLVGPTAQIVLSANGGGSITFMTHYGSVFLPAVFMAWLSLMQYVLQGRWPRWIPSIIRHAHFLLVIIFCASLYGSITYGSVLPVTAKILARDALTVWRNNALAVIPPDAPVATTYYTLANVANRDRVFSFHYAHIGKNQFSTQDYHLPSDTAYLYIDWEAILEHHIHFQDNASWKPYAKNLPTNLRSILTHASPTYAYGPVSVWQYSQAAESGFSLENLARLEPGLGKPTPHPILTETRSMPAYTELWFDLPEVISPDHQYYLTIATPEARFKLPFGYGMFSNHDLTGNGKLVMRVFLPDTVSITKIQVFAWTQGHLKINGAKSIEAVTDAQEIQVLDIGRTR